MEETKNNNYKENTVDQITAGMYLITAVDGERPTGCIVSSAFAVSHAPFVLGVSLNNSCKTLECVEKEGKFGLCVMSELGDPYYIARFGFQSGRDNDKFFRTEYEMHDGIPVVKDTCGYFGRKARGDQKDGS